MNLLTKDKYRAKIMQHFLHEQENDVCDNILTDSQNIKYFEDFENIKNQSSKIYSCMLFDKVSKQKPLICDNEKADEDQLINQLKQVQNEFKKQKENIVQNIQHKSQPKQKRVQGDEQALIVQNEMKSHKHLHKEPYTYHQKLPIMSVSQDYYNQILKKLKTNPKVKLSQNKENDSKESNHPSESQSKGKKYRFLAPQKVAQILKSKRNPFVNQNHADNQNDKNVQNHKDQLKQKNDNLIAENLMQRSKGSKEMMAFLESARDKLFSNINSHQIIQFEQKQIDQIHFKDLRGLNSSFKFQQKDEKRFEENLFSFKIEIEISATRSIELKLNLSSDPQEISRSFILLNKNQLSTFTDTQIRKLQQLLSRKIQSEIEKKRKILKLKKSKQIQNKNLKVTDHVGVHQNLLNHEDEILEIPEKNLLIAIEKEKNVIKNKMIKTDHKKALKLSHIYIEKIGPPPPFAEEPEFELSPEYPFKNGQAQEQQNPRLVKLVSFDPKYLKNNFSQTSQQFISLDGYINSPHQLITYRPESSACSQNHDNEARNSSDIPKKLEDISHFPLSASLSEFPQMSKNLEPHDIGASKILSKSRSKLLKKLQKNLLTEKQENLTDCADHHIYSNGNIVSESKVQQITISEALTEKNKIKSSVTMRSINSISSQIISKVGKENILNSLKEKQINKKQMILRQKEIKEIKEMKECSFKPKINNLSKSIDKNKKKKIKIGELIDNDFSNQRSFKNSHLFEKDYELAEIQPHKNVTDAQKINNVLLRMKKSHKQPRYEELYANYKEIEARKEYVRQKSIQEISFKPQINKISKRIIETKRNSLNNSTCQQYYSLANSKTNISRHHSACKKPHEKRHSVNFAQISCSETQTYNHQNKRKSLNFSRNLQGLQIGEYLYKEAMRMKKKKQSISHPKQQNFKPLQKSEQMVSKIKQKILTECFFELLNISVSDTDREQYEFVLKPQYINLSDKKYTSSHLKFLVPLLEELKELDASLTKDQFIESGLKLISCLSQDEKAQFLGRKSTEKQNQSEKQQPQRHINKLSEELIEKKQYYLQDIYHRGILYRKHIKEKLEVDMENKVRNELQKCTFKPKINANSQIHS